MKKIFTLLFAAAIMTTAFAQYDPKDEWNNNKRDARQPDGQDFAKDSRSYHDNDFRGTYYFTAAERDMQIAQIDREYDYKIRSVKNKFFMDRYQKMRQVKFLEEQKYMKIQSVFARFSDRRNKSYNNSYKHGKNW